MHGMWSASSSLPTFSFIDRQILGLLVGPIKRDLGISDTEMSLLRGFAPRSSIASRASSAFVDATTASTSSRSAFSSGPDDGLCARRFLATLPRRWRRRGRTLARGLFDHRRLFSAETLGFRARRLWHGRLYRRRPRPHHWRRRHCAGLRRRQRHPAADRRNLRLADHLPRCRPAGHSGRPLGLDAARARTPRPH